MGREIGVRVEGWPSLLNAYVEAARRIDFAWGINDCALWSADWVRIATGLDFASDWRGAYSAEAELIELFHARGFSGPQDIPAAVGLPQTDVAFAQRGDIVLNAQGCLGVCNGVGSAFLIERGVTAMRTRDCTHAWAVR